MRIEALWKSLKNKFFLIAGPCVVEDTESPIRIAEQLKEICQKLDIPFIFKASYRKANRSRLDSFTGIGDQKALLVLSHIRASLDLPVLTDVHSAEEAKRAADFVDVLQIPAFLCRQTDLLLAAARTGKVVNIKKGQFLSPEAVRFAVDKVRQSGNDRVCLTERGTMFGYGDLIVDYRGIPIMKESGCPVIIDGTHSLQRPNTAHGVTGGQPHLIETICRAAVAVGVDGLFLETHPEPSKAKSDGANMLPLHKMKGLLERLKALHEATSRLNK